MVFFYCNDTCKMPFKHIAVLCNATGSNLSEFKVLPLLYLPHYKKSIQKPEFDEQLAEFLGVLSGDGCIVSKEYSTNITCDALLDNPYIVNEVAPLIASLFGVKPKLRILRSEICCRVYSKNLFDFLSKDCSFPIGEKKNRLTIPVWISARKRFSAAFLRGLFDTDGGFHRHHKKSSQVEYTSHSPEFLKGVYSLLKSLGLNPCMGKEQVWILKKEKIDEFFKIVGSRNKKHLYKREKFKETGMVPLARDMVCGCRDLNPGRDLGKVVA